MLLILVVRILKLMLNIEQPNACSTRDEEYRTLYHKKGLPANRPTKQSGCPDYTKIGNVRVHSFLKTGISPIKPVIDQEDIDRTETEHDQRITVHPIEEPFWKWRCPILLYRQSPYVPRSPLVQITACRMVNRVAVPPLVVRAAGHNSCNGTDNFVRRFISKKRFVAAVMENDEDSN